MSFFKIFLCPILPLGFGRSQLKSQVEIGDSRLRNPDDSVDNPEVLFAEEINVARNQCQDAPLSQTDTGTNELTPLEQENDEPRLISSDSTVAVAQQKQPSGALRVVGTSEDVFCAELNYDEIYEEECTTATVEIVFMPLPSRSSSNRDVDPVGTTKEGLERAVRFLDGTVPQSRLREVDIFFHDISAGNVGVMTRKSSCYLLQYQLDIASLKKGTAMSILPPV